tara:strand:+ start:1170 stop:2963 length:1794 start_codon:yes stop_codon:yes gene_type:complete
MTNTFKEQIKEDINLLKEKLAWDSQIGKDEYTFNYWVLSNLYSLDEEDCNTNITEYNDKGIDCFVHYEDDKELYIIQNKYYDENTPLSSKEVSDFLTRPLAKLEEGKYTRSAELQKIYLRAKEDSEYKIFLHFYVSNDKSSADIESVVNNFDNSIAFAKIFFLEDIKEKYFGESFSENPKLNTTLKVKNKGTYLAIRPDEYALPNMSEAYYVMAKITDVFNLWKSAEESNYPLFEENIREYLGGTSGINKAIIGTLKNPNERGNFFYYNNGITIICDRAKADAKKVDIVNPQIVNGCQTVNSIAEVLKSIEKPETDFDDVYVMVKILILEKKNNSFYRDIVRYTNSQNSINEKVFGATLQPFFTIQDKLKEYGILLGVKQSDRFQFKETYKDKKSFGSLINIANGFSENTLFTFKTLADLQIPLETLIQIIGSYVRDAHLAYTKKSYLLKPTSKEYYQSFSTKIGEILTIESMAKLVLLYKKAEKEKRASDDKRSPSPYYLLNFIGYYLRENKIDLQRFLKSIKIDDLDFVYDKFKTLSSKYIKAYNNEHGLEYNQIIKQKIDLKLMESVLNSHINSLEEYNNDDFKKLNEIFEKNK